MRGESRTSRNCPKCLLLTGRPGVGKTTLIRRAVDIARGKAGGFYTLEVREVGGRRAGFEIITLEGERAILAHVRIASAYRVGRYGVDVEALARVGVSAIRKAAHSGRLVVIDEIGKMELCSEQFRQAVMDALESGERTLGTITKSSHPLADRIKKDPRVWVLEVSKDDREQVYETVVEWLRGWPPLAGEEAL